jgi:flagellar basal-body rod protein FlgC
MNLFGLMDTSGGAMQVERMRAEVVAANMANAETTHTAAGGPYKRQHVIFSASQGDPGFLDSLATASGTASAATGLLPSGLGGAGAVARIRLPLWSATIPAIPTRGRTGLSHIRTLIHSQRWWT